MGRNIRTVPNKVASERTPGNLIPVLYFSYFKVIKVLENKLRNKKIYDWNPPWWFSANAAVLYRKEDPNRLFLIRKVTVSKKKRQNKWMNDAEKFSVRDFFPTAPKKKYHLSRLEPTFVFEKQYKLYFHCRAISRGSYRFLAQLRRAKLLQSGTAGGTTRPWASADGTAGQTPVPRTDLTWIIYQNLIGCFTYYSRVHY